jgi:hypothetical protein
VVEVHPYPNNNINPFPNKDWIIVLKFKLTSLQIIPIPFTRLYGTERQVTIDALSLMTRQGTSHTILHLFRGQPAAYPSNCPQARLVRSPFSSSKTSQISSPWRTGFI